MVVTLAASTPDSIQAGGQSAGGKISRGDRTNRQTARMLGRCPYRRTPAAYTRAAIQRAIGIVTRRIAIDNATSHAAVSPATMRLGMMNGLMNGIWERMATQPARMSRRPVPAYTATRYPTIVIMVIGMTAPFTSSWRLTRDPAAAKRTA